MDVNKYVGHPSQLSGVEEMTLSKGRGKGMTLLSVRNGKGLEFTLSADRAMDISRLSLDGVNMSFISPCGYVAPAFYDKDGFGFLKSFTAGFMTTCGLTNIGQPCNDDGEALPQHGTIANIPCDNYYYQEDDNEIKVTAILRDAALFGRKLQLTRTITCSKTDNILRIEDTVKNIDSKENPCMLLYHCNMGYPLISENAQVFMPANSVHGRSEISIDDIDNRLKMIRPEANYVERCYFYDLKEKDGFASVGIYNPDIQKGIKMTFDKKTLDCFTEWKNMGEYEYVLGLEPGNCYPAGRTGVRDEGLLKTIKPGEEYKTYLEIKFTREPDEIVSLGE